MSVAKGYQVGSGLAVKDCTVQAGSGLTLRGNTFTGCSVQIEVDDEPIFVSEGFSRPGSVDTRDPNNPLLEETLRAVWGVKPTIEDPASDIPTSPDDLDLENCLTEFLGGISFQHLVVVEPHGYARFLNIQDLFTFEYPKRSEGMVLLDRKLQVLAGEPSWNVDPRAAAALFLACQGQDFNADLVAKGFAQQVSSIRHGDDWISFRVSLDTWIHQLYPLFQAPGTHWNMTQSEGNYAAVTLLENKGRNPWYKPTLRALQHRFPLDFATVKILPIKVPNPFPSKARPRSLRRVIDQNLLEQLRALGILADKLPKAPTDK